MNDHGPCPSHNSTTRPGEAPRAAYIHVPFCRRRCGYCNFTVVAGRDDLIPRYLDALQAELQQLGGPHPVETIFLGGGTPSHLDPDDTRRLLRLVRTSFPLSPDGEWSIEANPEDVTPQRCAAWHEAGVTRVSLGVQSFQPRKLGCLERQHTAAQVIEAVETCRCFPFTLSLDLMFGAPNETAAEWQADLEAAIRLAPEHLSVYGLTIEKGSRFYGLVRRHAIEPVAEETERTMYLDARSTLQRAGYEHYEISNFARPGHRCRHNESYWLGHAYWAAGPGAASFVDGLRRTNHGGTLAWIGRIEAGRSPVAQEERLDEEAAARLLLVLGLRRLEGVSRSNFRRTTGFDIESLAGDPLRDYAAAGWLVQHDDRWQLTEEGILISDALWHPILDPPRSPQRYSS